MHIKCVQILMRIKWLWPVIRMKFGPMFTEMPLDSLFYNKKKHDYAIDYWIHILWVNKIFLFGSRPSDQTIRSNPVQERMHRAALIIVRILIGQSISKPKCFVTLGDTHSLITAFNFGTSENLIKINGYPSYSPKELLKQNWRPFFFF